GRGPARGAPGPASAPRAPPAGGTAERPQSAGPPPDYRDGPAPGPGPAPPDTAAPPAWESPGTTTRWPRRPGTARPGPRHCAAPGPAASSGRTGRAPARTGPGPRR